MTTTEALRLVSIPPGAERERFLPLLLLADEAEVQVRSYYQDGELFALAGEDEAAAPLGMVLVLPLAGAGAVELKAVAIAPAHQQRGLGQRMLALVLDRLRAAGIRRVVVGTGNSGIGQLAFYQKAGFRLAHIERDFFTPARGYPADLTENGIPLRDMVWMEQEI